MCYIADNSKQRETERCMKLFFPSESWRNICWSDCVWLRVGTCCREDVYGCNWEAIGMTIGLRGKAERAVAASSREKPRGKARLK